MAEEEQPSHVDATVEQLTAIYEDHHRSSKPIQRQADRLTMALARPASVVIILGITIVWIVGSFIARLLGSSTLEDWPFPDLALFATIAALLVALLILTTQRHLDELAEKRARLTLQIAVLSEKKIAKVIELLEEQRRDNPMLNSRPDREASDMAAATDARSSLEQIEKSERAVG